MKEEEKSSVIKSGEIAKEVRNYAKSIIKKDVPLLEIAEKIESKIKDLGGEPAFPVNLSINDVAAHYTPSYNDVSLAKGLLKVDFGVHIDGWIADTAFSLDLEEDEDNKKIIDAAEKALENALNILKPKISTSEIGRIIQITIENYKLTPIVNLSGHSIEKYDLHSGITIPNIDDRRIVFLEEGLFAIEPFATNGQGKVYEGAPSGIYVLVDNKNIRSTIAREILTLITEEYGSLPFCSRWIINKIGTNAIFGLKQLEENGNIHQFPQLIEAGHGLVAQAEHTVLIDKKEVKVTTKE